MTGIRSRARPAGADDSAAPAEAAASHPKAEDALASEHPTSDDAIVRRTKDGWRVGGAELPDLTSAMVLADLIAAELAAEEMASTQATAADMPPESAVVPPPAKSRQGRARKSKEPIASEASRLRATIGQLEHALTARVRVEQAIGVLAERHRIQPRQAFEQLRNAARSRGKRVIDIASDVVASATNPLLQLPEELSRPRSATRRGTRPRGILGSE